MIQALTEPWTLSFMRMAFIAATLAGVACATTGSYVVLRRMAFMGDALAHTILPGIVGAWFLGLNLFWGGLVSAVATALCIGWLAERRNLQEDSAIGVVFSAMFALGVLMMSKADTWMDFHGILFGNLLGIGTTEVTLLAGVGASVIITLLLLHKELELTSMDPIYAKQIGLNPNFMRYLLLVLTALTVVCAIQAVGVLMTGALLITPAAGASLVCRTLPRMMITAAVIATISGICGLYFSYHVEDIAAGAAVVLSCTACFAVCWFSKGR